ncbi:MAG: pyridoxamine 5'-phosphate oxidase family protein [Gammaproteobacteria bacterium]|nr:pyridoxamine 5'-phosphate oxidase family protein [Gammaproteobacteria bacterium]MDH4313793.1 pyridoxamine 5'-phosphate oxidase family protein [Gammaproteobacteria bacterium]MDH5215167.1 pyridoxamine 5'-phosphate oxidase family protein [Gammaproteobacteria bacterium]
MKDKYSVSNLNKFRQLREKGVYDKETVHKVLDAGLVAHVAFVEDGRAVVVPMIYGRHDETVYLHGARKARVIRMLESNDRICINVTLVDGIVLARSAFNSSMNYRSVTVFGTPQLIEAEADKLYAMKVISEHLMPGRWDELRDPLDKEVKMTGVIEVSIDTASAKIATGMPTDEPEDYEIPVWAGVLPLVSRLESLQDDDRLLPDVKASAAVRALQNRTL